MHYDPSNPHQHYTRDVSMSEVNMIVDYVNRLEFDYTEMQRELAEARKDAARYRLLRRGQHWSVINGIGDTLRAGELDATIDAAMASDPPAR